MQLQANVLEKNNIASGTRGMVTSREEGVMFLFFCSTLDPEGAPRRGTKG